MGGEERKEKFMVRVNPTATAQDSITLGAADAATGAIAALARGVKGAFSTLRDPNSLIGRIAFQVPATMLAVTPPSAAQQQAAIQAATNINNEANQSRQMAGLLDGLGSMFAGFICGPKNNKDGQQLARASSSGCGPNGCGAQAAWESQSNCGPNGCTG